jgi:antitoxin YefM
MLATNYTDFRNNLKKFLDAVEVDNETIVLKRSKGKGSVIISLEEYNSMMETLHLLKSKKNADQLYESIRQVNEGKVVTNELIGE